MAMTPYTLADQSMDLGLWTYHFDRDPPEDECTNEKHGLFTFRNNKYGIGAYKNSHCLQSYLVSYRHSLNENWHLDVSAVSGYPKNMHVAAGLVLIPALTYTRHYKDIGVSIMLVPAVLIGGGLNYKFKGI